MVSELTSIEPMQGMSEDEGDENDEPEIQVDTQKIEAAKKARDERAEKLRKMMDDDGKYWRCRPQELRLMERRRDARCACRRGEAD
jgi:hypothetical protein